jgi:hypothetical protein
MRSGKVYYKDLFADRFSINTKTLTNIYSRFQNDLPEIQWFISLSFLSNDMKEKYLQLVSDRYKIIFG